MRVSSYQRSSLAEPMVFPDDLGPASFISFSFGVLAETGPLRRPQLDHVQPPMFDPMFVTLALLVFLPAPTKNRRKLVDLRKAERQTARHGESANFIER